MAECAVGLYWPQAINFISPGSDRDRIEQSLDLIADSWALLAEVDRLTNIAPGNRENELARADFNRHCCRRLRAATEDAQHRLERDLERMARSLCDCRLRIAQQRRLIDWRRVRGTDTRLSEALLATFEDGLAIQQRQITRMRALRKMSPQAPIFQQPDYDVPPWREGKPLHLFQCDEDEPAAPPHG